MFMSVKSRAREEGKSNERVACVGWPSMTGRSDFQGSRPSFDRDGDVLRDDMAPWPALRERTGNRGRGIEDGYTEVKVREGQKQRDLVT